MGPDTNDRASSPRAVADGRWRRLLTTGYWRQRRVILGTLVVLDALVVLYGTFIVWLVMGFADMDRPFPAWISPTTAALGVTTVLITLAVARGALRRRPSAVLILVAVCLHLGLAIAHAVAFEALDGSLILVAGAAIVGMAWTTRSAGSSHRSSALVPTGAP